MHTRNLHPCRHLNHSIQKSRFSLQNLIGIVGVRPLTQVFTLRTPASAFSRIWRLDASSS
ncbi:Chloroplast envelope membrane protein [Psidium guajava]|nr:Chloroplast envelope membrane protein [Psidium guajava]